MAAPLLAPFLVAALVGGFASGIVQGIIKALISIGVGFVVYEGIDIVMNQISTNVIGNLNALPFQGILAILKIDKCINVLISAGTVRLLLKGVTNGVIKKMELKQ